MKKIPQSKQVRRERVFLLFSLMAAMACAALAFYFAVPLKSDEVQKLPDPVGLEQYVVVDLNTADLEALCTLPGVGESRARAILEYREQHGKFGSVAEAANIPGLTEAVVASWEGRATVS